MSIRIPYGSALLKSSTRYGTGSEREGFLSPRSAATRGIPKPAMGPDTMAPDDETLVPAPSVTGEAHGPGGTTGNPTRGPQLQPGPDVGEYGTPFMGNQPEIDFQAQQAIDKRSLLKMKNIREEEALRGNPQADELEARKLTHELENYQRPGVKPQLRFSQGGMMTEYLPDDTPAPDAPNVGEERAARAAGIKMESNPTIGAARIREKAALDKEAKAGRIIQDYNAAVAEWQKSGDPNAESTIQQLTNDLHNRLASLGVRPPGLVDPQRVAAP